MASGFGGHGASSRVAGRRWAAYAALPFGNRLWELGLLEAKRGSTAVAAAVAAQLAGRAVREGSAHDRLLAASLEAHIALAQLDALVPAITPGDVLRWDEAEPLGAERLEFARLLPARGKYRRAIDVANVFDSA